MAAGKSTVGRVVARRLGLSFVDLDRRIEAAAGRTIVQIFDDEGEAGFRRREAQALERVLAGPDVVLALGGGTLHHGDNARAIAARFPVVVLDLVWSQLDERLRADSGRPLSGQARGLWEARRPGYLEAGDVVDITGLGPEAAADAVLEHLC